MSERYKFLPNVPANGPKKAEELITKNLLRLSFQDRNAIDEEIHGVTNLSRKESPEILHESLTQLSKELSKIRSKAAFDKSQRLNHTFVNTIDFRLRFLRCEFLDAQKAAIRIVAYLALLDELFDGDWALQRPIEITDFSKDEIKILKSGIFQLLPYRDRSGRPVYMELGDMGFSLDLKTRMRIRSYFHYIASNDVEGQRKGMVSIAWAEGDFTNTPMPLRSESRRLYGCLLRGMPIRMAAGHFCVPDTLYFRLLTYFIVTVIDANIGPNSLPRHRIHVVEGTERRYRLRSFGIPVETIPITETGNIKRSYLHQWIKNRKIIESRQGHRGETDDSIILLPSSNDVLIRIGTKTLSHPGNMFFRGMIEEKHNELRLGSQCTQGFLAETIVKEIERLNGRFLSWDKRGYWMKLREREQIIFKVEVSIRDFKTKIKARANPQNNHSSTNRFEKQDGTGGKRKLISICNGDTEYR